MATYFDATNSAHKNLLPPSIRSDGELANVAAVAEADVIAHFTGKPPYTNYTSRELYLRDGIISQEVVGEDVTATGSPSGAVVPQIRVYLRGYKTDADHANTDPNLKVALRRSIAEVIHWRILQQKEEKGPKGELAAARKMATDPYPPNWDRWLIPFVSEEPFFG